MKFWGVKEQPSTQECKGENCSCKGDSSPDGFGQVFNKKVGRRKALGAMAAGLAAGVGLTQTSCSLTTSGEAREEARLKWDEYFKGNFRLMTDEEKEETVVRGSRPR